MFTVTSELKERIDYKMTGLPYHLHPNIDLIDIQENGKLFNEEEIKGITEILQIKLRDKANVDCVCRFSKSEFPNIPPARQRQIIVEVQHNEITNIFAVYKGVKHEKHLGVGSFGSVKLMQKIWGGNNYSLKESWYALKMQMLRPVPRKPKFYTNKENQPIVPGKTPEFKTLQVLGQGCFEFVHISDSKEKEGSRLNTGIRLHRGKDLENLATSLDRQNKKLSELQCIKIVLSLLNQIQTLHAAGIIHRDIKPSNFIWDSITETGGLIDLGMALFSKETGRFYGGTPGYIPPEILKASKLQTIPEYSSKTDVYSAALTIANFLYYCYGTDWRNLRSEEDAYARLAKCSSWLDVRNKSRQARIYCFLKNMIHPESHKRFTIKQALDFFNVIYEELTLEQKNIPKNIVLLNVDELLKMPSYRLDTLIHFTLDSVDEIRFIDTSALQTQERTNNFIKILRKLEARNINFKDQLFIAPGEDPHKVMTDLSTSEVKAEANNKYYYIDNEMGSPTLTPIGSPSRAAFTFEAASLSSLKGDTFFSQNKSSQTSTRSLEEKNDNLPELSEEKPINSSISNRCKKFMLAAFLGAGGTALSVSLLLGALSISGPIGWGLLGIGAIAFLGFMIKAIYAYCIQRTIVNNRLFRQTCDIDEIETPCRGLIRAAL